MAMTAIIITNYNYAHFLPECIESCLKQKDVNIIAVDDDSTDNSWDVMQKYEDRVTLLPLHENVGVSQARNAGLCLAFPNNEYIQIRNAGLCLALPNNEYIQILDADDMLTEGSIAMRAEILDGNPKIDAVYGATLELKDGKITPHKSEYATHSILFRRKVFEKYGLFYPMLRTKEDKEFKYRIGLHEKSYQKDPIKVKKIDKPVAIYRRHDGAKRKLRSKDLMLDIETYMEFDKRCKDVEINGLTAGNTIFV